MVQKSEFVSAFDIAAQVFKKLANAVIDAGGSDAELRRLESDSELRGKIAALIVSVAPSIPTFSRDMRKEGWTLPEPGPRRSINSIADLEPVSFLKKGENYINGEEMVQRARKEFNVNFGQEDAEWVLANQHLIPKEWRNYYLVFPGTVWRDRSGDRRVSCLDWGGGGWCLLFYWLDDGWGSDARVLRLRK